MLSNLVFSSTLLHTDAVLQPSGFETTSNLQRPGDAVTSFEIFPPTALVCGRHCSCSERSRRVDSRAGCQRIGISRADPCGT